MIDKLIIGNKEFNSRLMLGTGKYRTIQNAKDSIANSACNIITVAVRRLPTNLKNDHTIFLHSLDWNKLWLLPNTAGSKTAEEAIRMAFLGHELACQLGQPDNFFVKLEVISDPKYLLPDPIGTLKAAEFLVNKGFTVLPYINADPILALHLEDLGCATVMPLGSPIGSGQGLNNLANIKIIIENANIPVIVDAGIGTPSEATNAMEIGADGVLLNTAVAQAKNPSQMAQAMQLAVQAGRLGYLSGCMEKKYYANSSSPSNYISKL
uniref:Thiamine biosynthesis protein G n=1 Tax=Thalassionema bacillare TaxID=426664 RepID=UPI001EE09E33|nr:Thiamine biosynthesis protein G [Thalassionema bacillare]UHY40456.1 Thiamine biosynthesis protein G [Thalassionema bacillare]UHY40843.1 Thiamine biosynthesis protein G [Thalassionema bacillare]UHY41101.1 Thiamine biosynthesis protein G [Thalassionema bacillare]